MTIDDFIRTQDLEQSLLIGYYGGGNFGDELLLEVLTASFKRRGVGQLTIAYQQPQRFTDYHHDYGYGRIVMGDKRQLLRAIRGNRTLIIGGGGLWGLDFNKNVFLLSLMLFISRLVFGKRVFLLGVGFYDSTSRFGRCGAWLAAKAANHIIARDYESVRNFGRYSRHVSQDKDIAWQLETMDTQAYEADLQELSRRLPAMERTLFIAIRRFKPGQRNDFVKQIGQLLATSSDRPVIVSLMEPRTVDPDGYALLQQWQRRHPHITIADFDYNPVALYLWFQRYGQQVALIAPQFHLLIVALISGVRFMPIAYDNKVSQLLAQRQLASIPISKLDDASLHDFAETFYGENA